MMPDGNSLASVQKMVADILGIPAENVHYDIPIRKIHGWDHILHMTLIFRIQDVISDHLTIEQVVGSVTVRDFADLLEGCRQ